MEQRATGRLSRRGFLRWLEGAGLVLLALPGVSWARETARAIHEATRNTVAGAVGVRLRRLGGGRPRPYKPYPAAARTPLPPARATPARSLEQALAAHAPAPGFAGGTLPLPLLARLLESANGVTGRSPGGIRLRAAPSAGALYAGEIYVAAERVEGLERGLYYYSPLDGELARLRAGAHEEEVAGALEWPGRARGAAAAVLLSNVFARYRGRYANRGYRYALIDSGHIGENLRLAASSAGLAEWGPRRFHDRRLNDLLGIDGVEEAVCALHLLGAPGASPGTDGARRRLAEAATAGAALPEAADDEPERFHAATALVPAAGGAAAPTPEDPGGRAEPGPDAERVTLPTRPDPGVSVEAAIRARRSARGFASQPIGRAELGTVLAAAAGPAAQRPPDLALLVFVHRAEAVAPGLYRADADRAGLVPLRREDLAARLADACLGQEMAATAAVGIAVVGDLDAAVRRGGQRSYRDLCLGAGASAQRIYLAAGSLGLAARNLAAFVDARLNALAGLDGARRAVLHLTMVGRGA